MRWFQTVRKWGRNWCERTARSDTMRNILPAVVVGLAALAATALTPAQSQAWHRSNFGYGDYGYSAYYRPSYYGSGYGGSWAYYGPGYGGYSGYYSPGYYGYGGYSVYFSPG